ncbi:50S ribosomal protein L31 [Patescibacteria group bacterium]|nr:50S ribosomal protein L31 [Patescibacteria group bacterium]
MKQGIHPKYYSDCKVTCTCGNTFVTGSTLKEINVEICSKCHPFFTGKQTFADTKGRIEKFLEKVEKGKKYQKKSKVKTKKAKKRNSK